MAERRYPKAALVTGAGKRIGRAIALSLGRAGWAVAVHYRESRTEAEEVVGEIVAAGGRAAALRADLTREEQAESLVPEAAAVLGAPRFSRAMRRSPSLATAGNAISPPTCGRRSC